MIIVDSKDSSEVHIVLDGVSVTSNTSAALYVANADKVYVTMTEGSENVLVNGGSFEAIDDNNIDGAVFSKKDITFNGEGTLKVTSPVAHGIVSKKDIAFTGGTYDVSSASHAIVADDAVKISGGTYNLVAGKDGIHSENTEETAKGYVYISDGNFDIESEGDGISGVAYLQIKDGDYNITCGGGSENGDKTSSGGYGDFMGGQPMGPGGHGGMRPRDNTGLTTTAAEDSTSMKALKSDGNIQISGGTYKINSADDGIHSNLSVEIISGAYEIATGENGMLLQRWQNYAENGHGGYTRVMFTTSIYLIVGIYLYLKNMEYNKWYDYIIFALEILAVITTVTKSIWFGIGISFIVFVVITCLYNWKNNKKRVLISIGIGGFNKCRLRLLHQSELSFFYVCVC